MIENILHFIWQNKKFDLIHLRTTQNERLQIISVGTHNHNSGPDFFNGRLRIDGQLWAGNIEIHVKSSDWFVHQHQFDSAYDNVILHVVYEHDSEIFRSDGSIIPTLELKHYVDKQMIEKCYQLFSKRAKWINCENDFSEISDFLMQNWLDRLFIERLENKSKEIQNLLQVSNNDWEAVLFKMLAKNFGLKVNRDAFMSLTNSFDFSIVRKLQSNLGQLEALFFGQAGLLDDYYEEPYYQQLQTDYIFLKQKFQLDTIKVFPFQFFRLRPSNFPTIRLSQLANLYHFQSKMFSKVIRSNALSDFYRIFEVSASKYWDEHYSFNRSAKVIPKKLSESFIDLLIINAILPIKFCYASYHGNDINDELMNIISAIKPEQNSIVKKFNNLRPTTYSALQSQALLQLKKDYCDQHQCLKCAIGNSLLIK